MAKILVAGETSPVVRFGIRQHTTGNLKACSPCCNRSMKGQSLQCAGCMETWEHEREGRINLTGEINPLMDNGILTGWARKITKYPDLVMTVTT